MVLSHSLDYCLFSTNQFFDTLSDMDKKLAIKSIISTRLTVKNIKQSRDWYSKLFGMGPVEDQSNFVSFKVAGINFDILLADDKSPHSTGGTVVYWLIDDLKEMLEHVENIGGKIYRGPLYVSEIMRTIVQIQDPFGNVIGFEASGKFE